MQKYLREQGVSHRDIKPENMLVDAGGNLKIADFGLATVFRQHGQRRTLRTPCGTAMYMAPEVVDSAAGYEGDQVDLWSAAVVLFVMLAGCHPWEEPTLRCGHYDCFVKSRSHSYAPWNRFEAGVKDLLLRLLRPRPADRLTLDEALAHPWVCRANPLMAGDHLCADPARLAELLEELHAFPPRDDDSLAGPALTQIEMAAIFSQAPHMKALKGFSQPISSAPAAGGAERPASEAETALHMQRLARFYTRAPPAAVLGRLERQLNTMLVQHKIPPASNGITFATVDRRKGPLTGDISVHSLSDDLALVLFSKAKGDSLEFKRFFKFVVHGLKDLVLSI